MSKVSPNFANFTAGELSPLVLGRVDFQGYFNGASEITNFIVRTQGPVVRRPGTYYVAGAKYGGTTASSVITEAISGTSDDGFWTSIATFSVVDNIFGATGPGVGYNNAFYNFAGVSVPPHAIIQNAYVTFIAARDDSGVCGTSVYLNDIGNAISPTNLGEAGALVLTDGISWLPESWVQDSSYDSVDISSLVQTVVNRPDWEIGNSMMVIVYDDQVNSVLGWRKPYDYTVNAAKVPVLHINYSIPIRLVPFQFSSEQAYVLEFGHRYMRVYRDKGQVLSAGGTVYEITTPYSGASLSEIKWTQSADTMYLVHPNSRPQKLTRTGHAVWTIAGVSTEYGPCQDTPYPLNTVLTATSEGSGNIFAAGGASTYNVRATSDAASQDAYFACDVNQNLLGDYSNISWLTEATGATTGQRFHIDSGTTEAIDRIYYENCHSVDLLTNQGAQHFTLYGSTSMGAYLNTIWNDTGNAGWTALATSQAFFNQHKTEDAGDPQYIDVFNCGDYRFYSFKIDDNYGGTRMGMRRLMLQKDERVTINAGTTIFYAGHVGSVWRWDMAGGTSGYFTVAQYGSGTSISATVEHPLGTTVTSYWGEAAWSDYRGWPYAAKFHENRLIYAGSDYLPTAIWGSETGKYERFFAASREDSNSFTLTTQNMNAIRWIESGNTLLVGTTGGVLSTGSAIAEDPLSYDALCKTQEAVGCADIMPVIVGGDILYVQKGGRNLRQLSYTLEKSSYKARDLTNAAEHITESGVSSIALQQVPDNILWCVRNDGKVASLTYSPDEKVLAWTLHETDGIVESIAIIPGDEEDEIWLSIKRTIGGVDYRYIEYMMPQKFDTQYDCFFVDSGLSRNNAGTTTLLVTGLNHLAGCTVSLLVDGTPIQKVVNSMGGVSLVSAGTTIHIGLPYTSTLRTVNLEAGSRMGTVVGKTKRISEVLMRFYQTIGGQMGYNDSYLMSIPQSGSTTLFSGDRKDLFLKGYGTEAYVQISQASPLPMTILNIIPIFQTNEK